MNSQYITLKEFPFWRYSFNWVICIKVDHGNTKLMCGYKWDVLRGIDNFFKKEDLLNSNVIKVDIRLDIVVITTDMKFKEN